MTENMKETRVQFATRKLETAHTLYVRFEKLLDGELVASLDAEFNRLSMIVTESPEMVNAQMAEACKRLFEDVSQAVTLARVDQIRSLVERKLNNWVGSPYGEPFAITSANKAAVEWLKGSADAEVKTILAWIDAGWTLLKGELESPWGKCSCGKNLLPRQITDRTTSEKKWVVFKTCSACYMAEKEQKETAWNATQGRPVQHTMPGELKHRRAHAAARQSREDGHRNERSMEDGKKGKRK